MTNTDIDGIVTLLANDMIRVYAADEVAETATGTLAQLKREGAATEEIERIAGTITAANRRGTAARQSFADRTEMLQLIDLGDRSSNDIVTGAIDAARAWREASTTTNTEQEN